MNAFAEAGKVVFLVVSLLWGSLALAQDISLSITRSTRSVQVPEAGDQYFIDRGAVKPEPKGAHDVTIGVGYERAEGGGSHGVKVPLQYGYVTADELWNFRAETGFGRISTPKGTLKGVGDLTLLASRIFTFPLEPVAYQLWFTGGLTAPAHGDIGTDSYQQQGRVIAVAVSKPWIVVLAGVLVHANEVSGGVSSVGKLGHAELQYMLDNDGGKLIGKFDRFYQRGAGGSSAATLEYDRRLKKWAKSSLDGNFILTRGLTRGSRSTGAEFDLVFHF